MTFWKEEVKKKIGIRCGSRGGLPTTDPFGPRCMDLSARVCPHINILGFILYSVEFYNLSRIHSETLSSTRGFFP